jgi:hypothetical protein
LNKRQKEVLQHQLDAEKEVIEKLTQQYQRALNDIDRKIRILESDALTQSRVYRIEYQKALKMQVAAVLEKLHADEYSTIQQFLSDTYTDCFVGTVYDFFGQGVPFILPIDRNAAVKAVITDSKISESLYETLGVDTKTLKNAISAEITRGLAAGMAHSEIARNIAFQAKAPLSRAKTIVRTESHRIAQASAYDAQKVAVSKGAKVVKQWMSTLDGNTRNSHRRLDGQIREVDEPFEMGGKKAMYPGDFGDPAEDCNCRCQLLQRARIALDEDELKTLEDRAKFFGLDKSDDFADFRKNYLGTVNDWDSADAALKERLNVDARDDLGKIVTRGTTRIKQGFSAFPKDDVLYERIKKVEPDGNKFDVAMHGSPSAVAFGGTEANMSPRLLASIIRHSQDYHGQDIRLISCNTGNTSSGDYCFAEELANSLGVTVFAPNDLIFISKNGKIMVGIDGSGSIIPYKPNERKRLK